MQGRTLVTGHRSLPLWETLLPLGVCGAAIYALCDRSGISLVLALVAMGVSTARRVRRLARPPGPGAAPRRRGVTALGLLPTDPSTPTTPPGGRPGPRPGSPALAAPALFRPSLPMDLEVIPRRFTERRRRAAGTVPFAGAEGA